jgi:hypothetical protein
MIRLRRWHVIVAVLIFAFMSVTGNDCDGRCEPEFELFR